MEIISITNDKGGVGKTTTAVNIAVGLAKRPRNKRVLVIDLDAQYDASSFLGWDIKNEKEGYATVYDSLISSEGLKVYESCYDNVWLCPGARKLNDIEGHLRSMKMACYALRKCLKQEMQFNDGSKNTSDFFDYIIIDCPPNMGLLTQNALSVADSMLIPLQLEPLAIKGIGGVLETWVEIKEDSNPKLTVRGIVRCMVDKQLKLTKVSNELLEKEVGDFLCKTMIPRRTSMPTSQTDYSAIVDCDPYSDPALAYMQLIKELFG